MTRMFSALRTDVRLQFRNGLYYVSAGLALLIGLLTSQVFSREALEVLMPGLLFTAGGGTAYIFVAGMFLIERGQGVLSALVITPLLRNEYIGAKIGSVALLVLFESLLTALIGYGFGFNPFWLLLGTLAATVIFGLIGCVMVVRYESITDFLIPTVILMSVMEMPFLGLYDIGPRALYYLLPTSPPMALLEAAFRPQPLGELIYGVVGTVVVAGVLFWWAGRAFERYVIRRG